MATALAHLAELVGGTIRGRRDTAITGAATLEDARAGDITFIDSDLKLRRLAKSQAAAAIVPAGIEAGELPVIVVDDVHPAFRQLVLHFRPPRARRRVGVSPAAIVDPSAKLGADVDVHPHAIIGADVEIGDGCTISAGVQVMAGCRLGEKVTLMPRVVLYEDTSIGARTIVHAGAVIGAYGFGYEMVDGRHVLCAQLGSVEIGADVEVGAGSTIDRGSYGPTIIGEGTKIDNLVQIAHNCRIGRHNMICSQVGIAGSTTTGDYVVMAGQVGVRDHVHIGTGAVIGAKAGVSNDVPEQQTWFGCPASPERLQKLKFAAISKLPEMRKEFKSLKRAVEQLESQREAAQSGEMARVA